MTVTDLPRAVEFYERAIGLRVQRQDGGAAALNAGGEQLLTLVENRAARPAGRHAGLYHVALLHPSREELARAATRLASTRTPILGASDHGTHEAVYLADPDGNGLELAADRPREQWGHLDGEGLFAVGPQPLDLDGLLRTVAGEQVAPQASPELSVGHVHLHVADVDAALRFYTEAIGFDLKMRLGDSAAFVSAGGYHHHVAFNTWRGVGVPPAPADAVGLQHWTLVLPGEADLEALRARLQAMATEHELRPDGIFARDPSGNALLATVSR